MARRETLFFRGGLDFNRMNVYLLFMRPVDKTKQLAIVNAVYDLTSAEGLVGISMGRVAKAAAVSPATIYIYYKDKVDLLSRMYEQAKDLLDEGLAESMARAVNVDDKLRAALRHFIGRFQQYPREVEFLRAILANETMVDDQARRYAAEQALPIQRLFEAMQADTRYRPLSPRVAAAFFYAPLSLANTATTEELDRAIEATVHVFHEG